VRILLDTNVVLWWLADAPQLKPFRAAITDPSNDVFYSAVSVAEISLKASLGKLSVPAGYTDQLDKQNIAQLPLTASHAHAIAGLPWHHRDPFDRMIIAQALTEGLTVATSDRAFGRYGVALV